MTGRYVGGYVEDTHRPRIHALKTTRVVAVDGRLLADLMIEFNLGVTLEQTYEIKRIDSDFFEG